MTARSRTKKGLTDPIIDSPRVDVPYAVLFPKPARLMPIEIISPDIQRAYSAIADDPKYSHFNRIPDRIIQCVDYFGLNCNRATAKARLHSYYLFIGVIDNALDSQQIETGRLVLEYLERPLPCFDETSIDSDVKLVTETLKSHISEEAFPSLQKKLGRLYRRVLRERAASSMAEHIRRRRAVGALTADASYLLIRSTFQDGHEDLRRFMKHVGAVGCLIDSLIDLGPDRRLGLLRFKPSIADYAQLIRHTLIEGLRVSFAHPSLSRLFLQAIFDNLRDRFGRKQYLGSKRIVSRKDHVARVA